MGMRRPKNIEEYTDVESAAQGLEHYARDLRLAARPGDRVRWSLNVRCWNDEWLKEQRPTAVVVGQKGASS